MSLTGERQMKNFMKRVCLTLVVTLLGVVSLMKADSVDGAATKIVTYNNMINIFVEDQYGNKVNSGKLTIYNTSGLPLTSLDLSTGSLTHYNGKYLMKVGTTFSAYPEHFQKYVTEGTVKGMNKTTSKYPSSFVSISTEPSNVRVWYDPARIDHELPANTLGIYIDPKWKNTPGTTVYIASNTFRFTEKTGMFTVSAPAGNYSGTLFWGSWGGSFSKAVSSDTETQYIKRKIKLSELNSKYFGEDGSFLITDKTVKVATGNPEDCAAYIFMSGGMITIPVPDSQGYVEVYVEKSKGKLYDSLDYVQDNGSGGASNEYSGYPYVDMTVQGASAPANGYGVMGLLAGQYLIGIEMGANYTTYVSPVVEVKNSDKIQEIKLTVHKHTYSSNWKSDGTNHWKDCACGAKGNVTAHTYGAWVIDKAATEDATGLQHRNCTTCNYKQTETIAKLTHTHKHSTQWNKDETNHWHECACGDKTSVAAHSSKNKATETTAKICDICGYIMEPATGHISHIADASKYYYDESNHWYQCVGCNLRMEEETHNFKWVIDIEATEEMSGQKHEECTDCGYKKEAVEIPQIIIETEPDTEAPTETPTEELTEADTTVPTTEAETDSNDNGFNWIWLVVGIVAVLGVIIVIIIILSKKNKKKEE